MWGLLARCLGAAMLVAMTSHRAEACSFSLYTGTATKVVPSDGATEVSRGASILVLSASSSSTFSVTANGTPVPLGVAENLGSDVKGRRMWRLAVPDPSGSSPPLLQGSTEYVVSGPAADTGPPPDVQDAGAGGPAELSRFTTAAGYDKSQGGTAPVVTKLGLLRVRYPISEIGSGDCVFDEYIGYVQLGFTPATIPGATASTIAYAARLKPKNGSSEQSLRFFGDEPYEGRDVRPTLTPEPSTDWMVELDPTREYCLTLEATANGDRLRTPLVSKPLCATIEQLSRPGSDTTPPATGSSCSVRGGRHQPGGTGPALLGLALLAGLRRRVGRPHRSKP